jgi:hypothetical protein
LALAAASAALESVAEAQDELFADGKAEEVEIAAFVAAVDVDAAEEAAAVASVEASIAEEAAAIAAVAALIAEATEATDVAGTVAVAESFVALNAFGGGGSGGGGVSIASRTGCGVANYGAASQGSINAEDRATERPQKADAAESPTINASGGDGEGDAEWLLCPIGFSAIRDPVRLRTAVSELSCHPHQ